MFHGEIVQSSSVRYTPVALRTHPIGYGHYCGSSLKHQAYHARDLIPFLKNDVAL